MRGEGCRGKRDGRARMSKLKRTVETGISLYVQVEGKKKEVGG